MARRRRDRMLGATRTNGRASCRSRRRTHTRSGSGGLHPRSLSRCSSRCSYRPPQHRRASLATYYLSVGDSIAYGRRPVGSAHHGYADQLFSMLRQRPQYSQLRLEKLGCSGESTATSCIRPTAGPQRLAARRGVAFLGRASRCGVVHHADHRRHDIGIDCGGDVGCALPQIQTNLPVILSTLAPTPGRTSRSSGPTTTSPDICSGSTITRRARMQHPHSSRSTRSSSRSAPRSGRPSPTSETR